MAIPSNSEELLTKRTLDTEDVEGGQPDKRVKFAEDIVIGGKTVLNISSDKLFYTEPVYERQKVSRWSDPVTKKKAEVHDIHFDPIKSLLATKSITMPILAITAANPIAEAVKSKSSNKPKKRPTKWGEEWEKVFNPPPLPAIARGLPLEDFEYLIRLYRLDELIKKKNLGQTEQPDSDIRSPSPEPIYDKAGKRVNTTEQRYKDEMVREIQALIDECQEMNPKFVPPADWKNLKKSRKIYLPETSDNQNNYAGTILGQGGQMQKRLEAKTGCKISIRGRQSYTKRRFDYDPTEQTHVLIQAENDEDLAKGVAMVERLLSGEPEELNDIEKNEKYTVAAVESVLSKACENCGEFGHKIWECPNKILFRKPTVQCQICGDKSHPTLDCPMKRAGIATTNVALHKDYINFLKEINSDIMDKPLPNNPLSYMNFITDATGSSGLRITNTAHNPETPAVTTLQTPATTIPGTPTETRPNIIFALPPSREPSK